MNHRFGPFHLDAASGRLARDGRTVPLTPQPARLLVLLVERAGEVVTRDEIRDVLWGHPFIEADQGINRCVRRIRSALGDRADRPLYLETVPHRGYRFVAPVRTVTETSVADAIAPPATAEPARTWYRVVAAAAAVALVSLGLARASGPLGGPPNGIAASSETTAELLRAEVLLERPDPEAVREAAAILLRLLREHPDDPKVHARLAVARTRQWYAGEEAAGGDAARHVASARRIAPNEPGTLLAAGVLDFYQGRYEPAIEALTRAFATDPGHLQTGYYLGDVLRRNGEWERSAAVFEAAFLAHPRSPAVAMALSSTLVYLHRIEEAGRVLDHAVALAPDDPVGHVLRPIQPLWLDGDVVESAARLEQVPPDIGLVDVVLGSRTLARLYGDRLPASPDAGADLEVRGVHPGLAHLNCAEALWYSERRTEAAHHYRQARRIFERMLAGDELRPLARAEVTVLLASALAGLGEAVPALDRLDEAARLVPITLDHLQGVRLRQHATEVLVRVGAYDRALDHVEFLLGSPSLLTPGLLRSDPVWEPLVDHPRFAAVLEAAPSPVAPRAR